MACGCPIKAWRLTEGADNLFLWQWAFADWAVSPPSTISSDRLGHLEAAFNRG